MIKYNIYNYINDEEFLLIENRLLVVEKTMIEKLYPIGWKLTKSIIENDALIIDFIFDEEIFKGNIGLTYVDEPREPKFSFYVTKSYDEFNKRFFLKHFLAEDKSLTYYEEDINLLIDSAVALYKKWDKDFVHKNGIII